MKTFGVTDYTNLVPLKCCGQTDGRTDRRTDRRTDGRSGPTTRPAFAKATQVKIHPEDQEACPVMTNSDHPGQIFLSHPHTNSGFFFLHTIKYSIFVFKKGSQTLLNTLKCDI